MATPDPLRRYLQVQVAAEREVIAILNQTLKDIEGQLQALEGKTGIGAAVRRTQVSAARSATLKRLVEAWAKVGDVIEAHAASAMLAASQAAAKYDEAFLKRLGLNAAERQAYQDGLEDISDQAVQLAVNRRLDTEGLTKRTLSERVYQSQALVSNQVTGKIESALARGLSAREFADEVRGFINPDVPGGASYSARRLARTEINNAFHYQQIQNAKGKPWVNGMKWNLSGSHPKVDTCDSYARGGPAGDGVYSTGSVPGKPHPQCLCYLTPETVSPAEFERRLLAGDYNDWAEENLPQGAPGIALPKVDAKSAVTTRGIQKRHKDAIDQYWGGGQFGSEYLNGGLRSGKLRTFNKQWAVVEDLDDAIARSVLKEDTRVYRGVAGSATHNMAVGDVVRDKAFNSTSTDPKKVEAFRKGYAAGTREGKLIAIDLPKGHNAAFLPSDLDELLLARGSSFKVVEVTDDIVRMVPV